MSERKVFDSQDECHNKTGFKTLSELPICENCEHVIRGYEGERSCRINAVNMGYNSDDTGDITCDLRVESNTSCDRFDKKENKMSKHELGPWAYDKWDGCVRDVNNYTVARLVCDREEMLSTGVLMAAAPRLLEALKEVYQDLRAQHEEALGGYLDLEYEAYFKEIADLIKEAEGD